MDKLKFYPENHIYTLNDKKIPGVSEIFKALGLVNLDFVDPSVLEHKRELGTNVHKATELLDMGLLEEKQPEYLKPYIVAYKSFLDSYKPIIKAVEEKAYNTLADFPDFYYACTIDRVFEIKGELWVIDIKTGGPQRTHRLQLAGNVLAWNNLHYDNPCSKRGSLHLSSDGLFKLKEYSDAYDFDALVSAVTLFHWSKPKYMKEYRNDT